MKKVLTILICIMVALSAVACGGSGSSENGDPKGNEPASPASDVQNNAEIDSIEKAYSGLSEDKLSWDYNSSTQTIVISGEGPMREYLSKEPEWNQYKDQAEKVVIGDQVTGIGAGAFLDFRALKEVQLGSSVEYIGDSAFDYDWELRTVNFPASLKYIGKRAFYNTLLHSDDGFTFEEGLLYIGEAAFHSAFKESFVAFPASLVFIGKLAVTNGFVNEFRVAEGNPVYEAVDGVLYEKEGKKLLCYPAGKTDTVYQIPEDTTVICSEAIQVTNSLEKIVIPASVTKIEDEAIFWNYGLTSIEVDEKNANYMSLEGVLFTGDGKELIAYPNAGDKAEYTVPEGTEVLGKYSLSQASSLKKIHIPEGVKVIKDSAFFNCSNLEQVGLPKSLETVEDYAFGACDGLTCINYAGSSEDWKKISVGDKHNEVITEGTAKVICAE